MSDSFIIYTSYLKIFEQLTDAQLGQLTRHMLSFAKTGKEPFIEDPLVKLSFAFIKDDMERNQRKYEEKCERLRANARKRWDKKQRDSDASEDMQKHTNVCTSMQMHANAQKRWGMQKDANDTEACNNIQKHTNEFKSMQLHTKGCLYDSDSDSDSDSDVSKETDNNIPSKEGLSISENPKVDPARRCAKIDFAAIKAYWNTKHDQSGSAMRRLTLMSDQRKSNVRARIREYGGDVQKVYKAIDKAMASDFMNGKNGKGWVASFDWMMCPSNFPKVLEGNYDNEQPAGSQQPQAEAKAQDPSATARPSIGERYEQAKHQQPASQQSRDDKFRWVIQQNLEYLKKNPRNKPAKDSLARFYEQGVLQRLGIDWKPEK